MSEIVYTVRSGDSFAKIAKAFYGDPTAYVRIAEANGLDPDLQLPVGRRLRIPQPKLAGVVDLEEIEVTAQRLPTTGASNAPRDPMTGIETVTVEASRLPDWATDWKTWVLGGVAALLLWDYLEGQ